MNSDEQQNTSVVELDRKGPEGPECPSGPESTCTEYNYTDCDCTDCRCKDCKSPNCDHSEPVEQTEASPVKVYYTYDQIHQLIDQKAGEIGSDFDYIIAIGGGGLIPARMLRQYLNIPVIVVTIRFYDSDDRITSEPEIMQWDPNTMANLVGKRCLIVDEVFDSGSTMEYVVDRLVSEGIEDLSALVVHHKKKISNLLRKMAITSVLKNYYSLVDVTDEWIVYPWEADDIVEHNRLATETST
jgi:hypoxanthine phosphoribosyltransferase